jgi:hypothetical protein
MRGLYSACPRASPFGLGIASDPTLRDYSGAALSPPRLPCFGQDAEAQVVPGFRWLNEHEHLALEEVRGKPAEHSFSEERPALDKRVENPMVFERLHSLQVSAAADRPNNRFSEAATRSGF